MAPSQSSIADYTILTLSLPSLAAFSHSSQPPTTHTIYLRPHAPKIPTDTDSRSIFLVNVPIDSTAAHFKAVFAGLIGAGRVEEVVFDGEKTGSTALVRSGEEAAKGTGTGGKKRKRGAVEVEDTQSDHLPTTWSRTVHRSGGSAVVVLVDEKSVELALRAIRKLHAGGKKSQARWPVWGEGVENGEKVARLGSARYEAHHKLRYPSSSLLQGHVDDFMRLFNRKEEEAAQQAKKSRNVPDEDGFVTVSRGGRTGPARMEEAERKRKELEEREKEKLSGRDGFYRFQTREKRKEEQRALVEGFEEDRRRVEKMREKRGKGGFRPEG